jgi:ATP-dependent DNA helicase RecG
VTSLSGIGVRRADALAAAGVRTVRDLLFYFPRRYLDRSVIVPLAQLHRHLDTVVTVIGRVFGIVMLGKGRKRLVVTIRDLDGSLDLVFFQGLQFWRKAFEHGEVLAASGTVNLFGRRANIVHPDIDRLQDERTLEFINTGGIIPVYPSGAELEAVGLNRHGGFRRIIAAALQRGLPDVEDPFDTPGGEAGEGGGASMLQRRSLLALRPALEAIHHPPSQELLEQARRRLIFDEFFALSLLRAFQQWRNRNAAPGIAFRGDSPSARRLVDALPFALTAAQKRVIREIVADMERPVPMNRLLQGDVGSGKTVVALLAMLVAVDNGCQCALMVPTEILAEQHYRSITALLRDPAVPVALLTGQMPAARRAEVCAAVANGMVQIVVGTHALIQESVSFPRLGFVVIDEQHRFGVEQRARLRTKSAAPDVLVMTATPIPRTLAMTLYGDLDVSVIDELPAGRKRIRTAVRFEEDRAAVQRFIADEVSAGHRAYIVYPLVSESEKVDLKAASEGFEALRDGVFPQFRVGLLHGRMPPAEKDAVMQDFARGAIDILVATTVIEVGVDVPAATVMLVEHADRFGLAQLHQLRGRVGRGTAQGTCILMTERGIFFAGNGASDARRRLETLRDSLDGFRIAEVDLDIRGPGDLWGTAQAGFPELRIADLLRDGPILEEAREEAFRIVARDPQLRHPAHERIRRHFGPLLRDKLQYTDIA